MRIDCESDIRLARAAAAGDNESREKLIRSHYDSIYRLARHLSRSFTEAEDLAQITFVKALSNLGRFDGRTAFKSWLAGILMHEFLHWRRKRKRIVETDREGAYDPSQQLLDREQLLNAIHGLPEGQAGAFILSEVNGFSIVEAAQILGIPEGTVKSRLHEARTRLRRTLSDPNGPCQTPETVIHES